ncbi:MAG TPA: GNAT family N-acetyltransferase [Gaiellaceae bacterium]
MAEPDISTVTEHDLPVVRTLLREYAAGLAVSLDFQQFDDELAGLPGAYSPPAGALLIARTPRADAGCVAVRPLAGDTCELKRLYVRPSWRGHGLGRRLTNAALDHARTSGYSRMRLDTLPGMETAQALYEELGFREIAPYTVNPVPGARFLELDL